MDEQTPPTQPSLTNGANDAPREQCQESTSVILAKGDTNNPTITITAPRISVSHYMSPLAYADSYITGTQLRGPSLYVFPREVDEPRTHLVEPGTYEHRVLGQVHGDINNLSVGIYSTVVYNCVAVLPHPLPHPYFPPQPDVPKPLSGEVVAFLNRTDALNRDAEFHTWITIERLDGPGPVRQGDKVLLRTTTGDAYFSVEGGARPPGVFAHFNRQQAAAQGTNNAYHTWFAIEKLAAGEGILQSGETVLIRTWTGDMYFGLERHFVVAGFNRSSAESPDFNNANYTWLVIEKRARDGPLQSGESVLVRTGLGDRYFSLQQ